MNRPIFSSKQNLRSIDHTDCKTECMDGSDSIANLCNICPHNRFRNGSGYGSVTTEGGRVCPPWDLKVGVKKGRRVGMVIIRNNQCYLNHVAR